MSPGDEQRFRELYDRTYDRVWAFVLRRIPDGEAAEDVVAETFLAVWRRIADVPTDAVSADAWVFGTARRVLANTFRGSKRRGYLFDRIRQRPVDLNVDLFPTDESNNGVMQALGRIPRNQREILSLSIWEELETNQIARILGCSENAAAIRLTRARQALRKELESMTPQDTASDESGGEP